MLSQRISTSVFVKKKAKFCEPGLLKEPRLTKPFTELFEIFQEGRLKTVIDRQYPLEKVAESHRYVSSGHKKGNVVIVAQS